MRRGAEPGLRERRRHFGDVGIRAGGVAAGVETAGGAFREVHHYAGFQVLRRQPNHHAVHVREPAQRQAFVLHAVLAADHPGATAGSGVEIAQRRLRVLALHAQDHRVVGADAGVPRMGRARHSQRHALRWREEAQAAGGNRLVVATAGDQHRLEAGHVQPRADGAADAAGAVDDEAQG